MEISKIVIENFKGIERVELDPIKHINVLIGRNNSGKSSILTCLQFMHQYFNVLIPKDKGDRSSSTISVPAEYFRRGVKESPQLGISVTVAQTQEERKKQFASAVVAWNNQYNKPQMLHENVKSQLEMDLFSNLTFDFVAQRPKDPFGLISISTVCKKKDGKKATIAVAEAQNPGGSMKRLALRNLFIAPAYHRDSCQTVFELKEKVGFRDDLNIGYTASGLSGNEPIFLKGLIFPAFEHIKGTFYTSFLVSPYRHASPTASAQMCERLSENGSNLINYIDNLNRNTYTIFKKIAGFVKKIVPEAGRLHPRFVGESGSNLELAYDWPEGHAINLANMGGGVEQLLILGCLLIHQRTACILWEEPESHLHPGAQEVLLTELERRVGDSVIFLTTQSPVFVKASSNIAVHAITNPDGKSAMGRTLSNNDLQEAGGIIGARPGHLAQADIVVYVEGKTGAGVVEEWLDKWPERKRVLEQLLLVVQSFNADEVGSDDFDLRKLKRVTPNMIVFADRDSDPGSREPKKIRKKLKEKCSRLGIPCILTKRRQIEDYFTEEAVKSVLPRSKVESWVCDHRRSMRKELESLEVSKKCNRRIAQALSWSEVTKHECLMQIFDEIKKYADKLKPSSNESMSE